MSGGLHKGGTTDRGMLCPVVVGACAGEPSAYTDPLIVDQEVGSSSLPLSISLVGNNLTFSSFSFDCPCQAISLRAGASTPLRKRRSGAKIPNRPVIFATSRVHPVALGSLGGRSAQSFGGSNARSNRVSGGAQDPNRRL